jgi:hypothetical protein
MRIAAKRLRYAIELFEQCWGAPIAVFARKVAGLQSSLGDLHDCDGWIDNLGGDLSKAKKASGRKQGSSVEGRETASVWLLTHFAKLRTKHFRNALVRWCEWDSNDFSLQLRKTVEADSPLPHTITSQAPIADAEALPQEPGCSGAV